MNIEPDWILENLCGKTIAVVYIFEGENAPGFQHYHIWKSDVITGWLQAIQKLRCLPLIFDVRTFVEKAVNQTLPNIDYVLNLNCGSCTLSTMGLVPSTCSFLGIPCIPCGTNAIITGEDKYVANLIAMARGMTVPQELPPENKNGIYRPLNYGSSVGVKRSICPAEYRDGTYQEFIPGFDITTPLVYNPFTERLELMPTVAILSDVLQPEWFYGEEENIAHHGIHRMIIPPFSNNLKEKYIDIARAFSISTFCRIDARIRCESVKEMQHFMRSTASLEDVYFLEINPMPSIREEENDFLYSFNNITDGSIKNYIDDLKIILNDMSLNIFLLASSMLSHAIAKYKKQKDYNHCG